MTQKIMMRPNKTKYKFCNHLPIWPLIIKEQYYLANHYDRVNIFYHIDSDYHPIWGSLDGIFLRTDHCKSCFMAEPTSALPKLYHQRNSIIT